jgi:hypothetical protein
VRLALPFVRGVPESPPRCSFHHDGRKTQPCVSQPAPKPVPSLRRLAAQQLAACLARQRSSRLNVIPVIARWCGTRKGIAGLVMQLIPLRFTTPGWPPSLGDLARVMFTWRVAASQRKKIMHTALWCGAGCSNIARLGPAAWRFFGKGAHKPADGIWFIARWAIWRRCRFSCRQSGIASLAALGARRLWLPAEELRSRAPLRANNLQQNEAWTR